jgi:hypothetical protein
VWHDKAERRLAELWLNADERSAVSTAADTIDAELAYDPFTRSTFSVPGYVPI